MKFSERKQVEQEYYTWLEEKSNKLNEKYEIKDTPAMVFIWLTEEGKSWLAKLVEENMTKQSEEKHVCKWFYEGKCWKSRIPISCKEQCKGE